MAKHISQREAHRLQKQVKALTLTLDGLKRHWVSDYPGVPIATIEARDSSALVFVARTLGHAVVALPDGPKIRLFGVR